MNRKIYNEALNFQEKLVKLVENFDAVNEDDYSRSREYFMRIYPDRPPEFLRDCRTLKNFTSKLLSIASGGGSWQARRNFIYDEFKDFLNFLEFGDASKYDEANIKDNSISIILKKEVFSHVKELLSSEDYFHAVEEAYKITRDKLKNITGKEKGHEAFNKDNYEIIFGHKARNEAEEDFFEGVKFLHMAIQKLRNEKVHTLATKLDKNLAIHYIVLASLAYDLIDRKNNYAYQSEQELEKNLIERLNRLG